MNVIQPIFKMEFVLFYNYGDVEFVILNNFLLYLKVYVISIQIEKKLYKYVLSMNQIYPNKI
jgi:hypothetical protein